MKSPTIPLAATGLMWPARHRAARELRGRPSSQKRLPLHLRMSNNMFWCARMAVAYTWQNGTLRYITPDGLRHTIRRDALDLNATQQFNEQRGLNFQAPA